MNLYSIQVAYKGTNGRLQIAEQEFEGESAHEALNMAKAYYVSVITYRSLAGMMFSTPQLKISNTGNGAVSIGGSANGVTVVTGNGNVVSQRGKFNINTPSNVAVHIGDILS